MPKQAIIIGAGPAGLTAAYELLTRTDIVPVILEKSGEIGGISRTINYKGNRMDMGPHRFFSKSDRVMDWWLKMMPLEGQGTDNTTISYQNKSRNITSPETAKDPDKVMLVIQRLTRIYFLRKFFAYPIQLSLDTLRTLGLIRTIKIMISFLWIRLFPRKPEKSLEDFIINKFGRQLYLLFFKDYTEKVWGIEPSQISAEWGAQRIKGVSLSKALASAVKSLRNRKKGKGDVRQKDLETSLVEQFLYPKYGPGSLWEEVARQVQEKGGKIYLHQDVQKIDIYEGKIHSVTTTHSETGEQFTWEGDYFFSTMPVKELIAGLGEEVPSAIQEVAAGLQYRDFINVGILLKQLSDKQGHRLELKDNWIYIQERDVKVGRLMIYNNWGGGMIKDPNTTWIGMEYFCNKTDAFWAESDEEVQAIAIRELEKMELARVEDVLDITVRRMEKTYPAYFGTYDQFDKIREYTDRFENLFLVGRNGMHKYNNADHSMLTAMVAVDNITAGVVEKANLWSINTEQEYHEELKAQTQQKEKNIEQEVAPVDFKSYVFKNKLNRTILYVAGIVILIQFIVFKFLYPHAGFIYGDSYAYIEAADKNYSIHFYPIGYSKFLRLFSVFSKSDLLLVTFQYLLIHVSALFFLFTLNYFYRPNKVAQCIMFALVALNPVYLYLSNYILSDSLFLGLSLTWFALLFWIINLPNMRLILLQVTILFLAFTVRYNAIYYPFITFIALILAPMSFIKKMGAMAINLIPIFAFVIFTSNQYKEFTSIRQFTPFSGWQIANNAMYAYRYVDSTQQKKAPIKFEAIDTLVRQYFSEKKDKSKNSQELLMAGTFYMLDHRAPLQLLMTKRFKNDSVTSLVARWASLGPFYKDYGIYLIKQHPITYLRYYIWPNTLKFYAPPVEFLGYYNMGTNNVGELIQIWFGYKSGKVTTVFKSYDVKVLDFLPIFSGILNTVFLFCLISIGILQPIIKSLKTKFLLLAVVFWFTNASFSIIASPITLRYQLFSLIITSGFTILLIEKIYRIAYKSIPDKLFHSLDQGMELKPN